MKSYLDKLKTNEQTKETVELLTVLMDRKERFESQWGKVMAEDWCHLESARINSNGGGATVVINGSLCAIARKSP